MMLIRPVRRDDLAAITRLAAKTGVGVTSLPLTEERLLARIERMLASCDETAPLADQGYLFVLEESEQQQVVGISGLEAAVGLAEAAPARLFEEVLKLLQAGYGYQTYMLLREYNLFQPLFPTITRHHRRGHCC